MRQRAGRAIALAIRRLQSGLNGDTERNALLPIVTITLGSSEVNVRRRVATDALVNWWPVAQQPASRGWICLSCLVSARRCRPSASHAGLIAHCRVARHIEFVPT
jgi:hypothetical protein